MKPGHLNRHVYMEPLETRRLLSAALVFDATTAHLVLQQMPGSTSVGRPLAPTPIVGVEDQSGNVVKSDHSMVTLSIASGPDGAAFHGKTVAKVHKGHVAFKKLSLNEAGDYTLLANDDSLPITTPVQFSVTIIPATVTIGAPIVARHYATGKTITISAKLKSTAGKTIPFSAAATLIDQNGNVVATATPSPGGVVKFSFGDSAAGAYTFTVSYAGDASHASAVSSAKSTEFITKTTHVPAGRNITYIGQFNATYSVHTTPPYVSNPLPPVTGSVSFNITLVLHPLVTIRGETTYTITSVQCSDPFFGAQFAVTPNFGSTALLPNPPLNISNQDGQGFAILFPNGSTLVTANFAGDMHQSSDGRTISNSLSDTQAWSAGANKDGQFLQDSIIPPRITSEPTSAISPAKPGRSPSARHKQFVP